MRIGFTSSRVRDWFRPHLHMPGLFTDFVPNTRRWGQIVPTSASGSRTQLGHLIDGSPHILHWDLFG
jgi:hypothetical protein